jgi:hypothetical protein
MKGATPSALPDTHSLPRFWQTDLGVDPLRDAWVEFAVSNGFVAKSFITMTFDPKRRAPLTYDGGMWWWRWLVRELNRAKGGVNYRRKWGHSYFGYVAGVEHHKSGAIHMHAVVDNWIDYGLAIGLWFRENGYIEITSCVDDPAKALRYVVKYVVKECERPSWWFQRRARVVVDGEVYACLHDSMYASSSGVARATKVPGIRHAAHVGDPLSRPKPEG